MVKLKKRILILIAAHVVGLTGFRYWQANDKIRMRFFSLTINDLF